MGDFGTGFGGNSKVSLLAGYKSDASLSPYIVGSEGVYLYPLATGTAGDDSAASVSIAAKLALPVTAYSQTSLYAAPYVSLAPTENYSMAAIERAAIVEAKADTNELSWFTTGFGVAIATSYLVVLATDNWVSDTSTVWRNCLMR